MLVQNILQENDLIFKRMNVQVTCIFIQIVLHKDSFFHRGKSQLFIHELAQGAFDFFPQTPSRPSAQPNFTDKCMDTPGVSRKVFPQKKLIASSHCRPCLTYVCNAPLRRLSSFHDENLLFAILERRGLLFTHRKQVECISSSCHFKSLYNACNICW